MSQRTPTPYLDALDRRLLVQAMTSSSVALLGASDRNNQIELRAGIDHPADAAQNSIHFSKCSKTIDVDRREARGLRKQFFVCHLETPGREASSNSATGLVRLSSKNSCKLNLKV